MLEVLFEGVVLGVCIVVFGISLILLTKFMADGITIALTPIPIEEDVDNDYATIPMQKLRT